jgi:hypothetical protein
MSLNKLIKHHIQESIKSCKMFGASVQTINTLLKNYEGKQLLDKLLILENYMIDKDKCKIWDKNTFRNCAYWDIDNQTCGIGEKTYKECKVQLDFDFYDKEWFCNGL